MRRTIPFILICAAFLALPARAADPVREVEAAVGRFLDALNNLDWPRFKATFADDVTLFHAASGLSARRVDNASQAESIWQEMFEDIRKRSTGPPYLHLEPKDTLVQMWGDTAVVTFHLDYAKAVGRRTLVMRRIGKEWKVVHMHASVLDL